ncbi:MAG TPA: hypothetical protein VEZ90_12725, partial [Blastocatellia bacterium]|nr:hypothetical protein [Blastocatellia bacterium]
ASEQDSAPTSILALPGASEMRQRIDKLTLTCTERTAPNLKERFSVVIHEHEAGGLIELTGYPVVH